MDKQEALEDLKITREEFDRITDAMKKEEFRKLFVEYCEEISDPANRKIYEDEIKQLESQRGVECRFVHPNPGYVIKTSNGKEKIFINIASNELVDKPNFKPQVNDEGHRGVSWSIPLIQAPPRKDMDKNSKWCQVYDVIFHPDSLKLAERDSRFREMLNSTALDAVAKSFGVALDRKNLRFPKLAYKGVAKPTVIRKKGDESKVEDMGPLRDIMPPISKKETQVVPEMETPEYTEPKYSVKYRKNIEMHEFTGALDAKMGVTVPKEIVIDIHLPMLRSACDADLDVSARRLYLCSEKPKYKLEVNLSYKVDDKNGTANFDKEKRILSVVLPVIQPKIGVNEIVSQTQLVQVLEHEESHEKEESTPAAENMEKEEFFSHETKYETPNFIVKSFDENSVSLVFEATNIEEGSIEIKFQPDELNVKFKTVGSGYFELCHGMILSFEDFNIAGVDWSFKGKLRMKVEVDREKPITTETGVIYGYDELVYAELEELIKEEIEVEVDEAHNGSELLEFESRLCQLAK